MATRQINTVLQHIRRLAEGREASPWTDQQLLDRFMNKKEEAAFTALVRRHGRMVMAVGWRVLRDREDAEDVFQAAFLVLARKARSIRKQGSIGGWLYRVAFRLALRVRAEAIKRRRPTPSRPEASPADPIAEISWREVCSALDEELARLPDRCRAPLDSRQPPQNDENQNLGSTLSYPGIEVRGFHEKPSVLCFSSTLCWSILDSLAIIWLLLWAANI